ncbi:MAG: DinB family protein [Clostridia bacterium]
MKQQTIQLLEYNVWANRTIFKHLKELPEGVDRQEVQSVFATFADALFHLYLVDNIWLSAMSGATFDETMARINRVNEEAKGKSVQEMEGLFEGIADKYLSFFHSLPDVDAVKEYPHPQYGILRASYAELAQHIVNHGTYHRGNVTAMLRQMGHAGVATDYPFFLYTLNR